jgi:hypothetical protein
MAEFENAMRLSPLDPQWGGASKQGMANAYAGPDAPKKLCYGLEGPFKIALTGM